MVPSLVISQNCLNKQKNNERKKIFVIVSILLSIGTFVLMPNFDDWELVMSKGMGEGMTTSELLKELLLPNHLYWRPLYQIYKYVIANYAIWSFPYINHIINSVGITAVAYNVFRLLIRMKINTKTALIASLSLIISATSMGSLLNIDSVHNVGAAYFGMLSLMCYISGSKYRYVNWLFWGVVAAFSKENGFVWFVMGPIVEELILQRNTYGCFRFSQIQNWKRFIQKCMLASVPILIFLSLYLMMRPGVIGQIGMSENTEFVKTVAAPISSQLFDMQAPNMDDPNSWYKLTPIMFLKNIGILYFLGIIPIDTTAVYYRNYLPLFLTIIFSIVWLLFLCKKTLVYVRKNLQEFIYIGLIIIWLSGPSLVTRAGEISPFINLTFEFILLAFIFNYHTISKVGYTCIVSFFIATLITDSHKFYISYKSGHQPMVMADNIISNMKEPPTSVCLVKVDNYSRKKAGAFIYNVGKGFLRGEPVRYKYNYEYPKHIRTIEIPERDKITIETTVDSIVENCRKSKQYDYLWFVYNENVKVYNLKK